MTTPLRIRVPDSTPTRLADMSAKLTAASGKPIDHQDTARIALEIGLRALETCEDCSARRRCAVHLPGSSAQRSLPGIPGSDPVERPTREPQDDFVRVRDVYFAEYERARGAKPVFRAAEGKTIKRLIADLGAEAACTAIRDTYANEYGKKYSTILTIAKDPGKYSGTAAKPATMQRSASPQWRRAPEVPA